MSLALGNNYSPYQKPLCLKFVDNADVYFFDNADEPCHIYWDGISLILNKALEMVTVLYL